MNLAIRGNYCILKHLVYLLFITSDKQLVKDTPDTWWLTECKFRVSCGDLNLYQSPSSMCQGIMSQKVYEFIISGVRYILLLCENAYLFRRQICIFHDSSAVVAWAKFWPDEVIELESTADWIFEIFQLIAHKPFVKCVSDLLAARLVLSQASC